LGFTVIGAIVTTTGSLIALFLKDFFFVRYFDSVKEKRALRNLFKKFNDPLVLSSIELSRRLNEITSNHSGFVQVFTEQNLRLSPKVQLSNDANDPYFLKYKIVSTLYRFCCLLGWLELYRQEMTFLENHSTKSTIRLLKIIEKIRTPLADGQLIGEHQDWMEWKDILIFREELRAIGEGMIENGSDKKNIIGYGKFKELIDSYQKEGKPSWLSPPLNFFLNLRPNKDFRLKRIEMLLDGVLDLIQLLNKELYKEQREKLRLC
jgi:hypothetical protein